MRHKNSGRKLGRNSAHRKAMYRNMVTSLIEHERITTTLQKAKELRSYAERTISLGVRLGDLLDKPKEQRSREEQLRYTHALRQAGKTIRTKDTLHKLFDKIVPLCRQRPGGYTRIIRLAEPRAGDAAEMVLIELVLEELQPKANTQAQSA